MEGETRQYGCCFFGHRTIHETPELSEKLANIIESLITEKGIRTFYFGSNSAFDDLCVKVITPLKEKYPHIQRIYVRSAFPDIDENYKAYLLQSYDGTYFPEKIRDAGKASYVKRNQEMIEKSKFCVVYYDENYLPPKRKNSRRDIRDYQPKSGTKLSYDYALRKNCEIINVFTELRG